MDDDLLRLGKKVTGGTMLALPFVGVFVLGVFLVGWAWALLTFVLIAVVIALVWVGIGLWLDN